MQIFIKQTYNKYSCLIKDNFHRFRLFFIYQLIVILIALFLGVFICLKNTGNNCLDRLFDNCLYEFVCGHINFFQLFLNNILKFFIVFLLTMLCFCNKKLCYISYVILFYIVFKLFFDIALLIKCLGLIGLIIVLLNLLFNALILFCLFIMQMLLLIKVSNQCNDFCFNFNFKNILFLYSFVVILSFIYSLLLLIFFPFINAFV